MPIIKCNVLLTAIFAGKMCAPDGKRGSMEHIEHLFVNASDRVRIREMPAIPVENNGFSLEAPACSVLEIVLSQM